MQLRKEGFSYTQIAVITGIKVRTVKEWVTRARKKKEAAAAAAASMPPYMRRFAFNVVSGSRAKGLTLQEIRTRYGIAAHTYNLWEVAYDSDLLGEPKKDISMKKSTATTSETAPYHKQGSRQVPLVGDGGLPHNAQAVTYEADALAEKDREIERLKAELRKKEILYKFIKKKIEIGERLEAERKARLRK